MSQKVIALVLSSSRHLITLALVIAIGIGGCSEMDSKTASSGEQRVDQSDMLINDAGSTDQEPPQDVTSCQASALLALGACVEQYSEHLSRCYAERGVACHAQATELSTTLNELEGIVSAQCADQDIGRLSVTDLSGRLKNACASEASSLAWRYFGGPQGAVWRQADADTRACLVDAHQAANRLVSESLEIMTECIEGEACDPPEVDRARDGIAESALAITRESCPDLTNLIAISQDHAIERAEYQVDCLTSTVYTDSGPLSLTCGPSYAQFEATRGEWRKVVVDGDTWGTLCGDGSSYAFYIKLAPEGQPLDRVMIGLQGGGVCVFEEDCVGKFERAPDLFTAMDDEPYAGGIVSDDPEVSPFVNWTKVYLPYCTQDVFAGGGETEDLGSLQLPRYGSVNLRASLRMTRDVLWKLMDEEDGSGFRPDQLVALFGGWSAGAYGTIYNYHWMVDDLQWPKTIAFPDAGLALDNGSPLGVYGLGLVKIPAWGTQKLLPPYCFTPECAIGPNLYRALSARIKQVPEQQILLLTNPRDRIQQQDAYFMDEALWINTLRRAYCETRDLPGISYYITSVADESVHVVSIRDELWLGSVAGQVMRDWILGAVTAPDEVQSWAEEGDFVTQVPGVEPYPCEVAP